MIRARLVIPWKGTGKLADPYRPRIVDDYPMQQQDVTAQPVASIIPGPNLLTIEAIMPDATLADIEADPNYGPGAVLWSEPYPG